MIYNTILILPPFSEVFRKTLLVCSLLLGFSAGYGQNSLIYGPTSVNQNDIDIYFNDVYDNIYWYYWDVWEGQVQSESETHVTVKWTTIGTQYIWYDGEGYWDWYWGDLEVEVNSNVPPPPAPVALEVNNVNSESFYARWLASTGATSYRLDVLEYKGPILPATPVITDLNVGNVLGKTITGLECNTTYIYRVRAVNGSGTSGNSSEISVKTLMNAPPYNVGGNTVTVTGSSFEAGWLPLTCASSYRLDVSTNSNFTTFVPGYEDRDVPAGPIGQLQSHTVTGLNCNTTYYYRVRAKDGLTYSPYSFTSNITTTLDKPANVHVNPLNGTSFRLEWDHVDCADSYRLDIATDSYFTNYVSLYQNYNVGYLDGWTVVGLSCNTTYYVRVRAVNGSILSNYSNITIQTKIDPPIVNSFITFPTTNGFSAFWSLEDCATYYTIEVVTNNNWINGHVPGYWNLNVGNVGGYNIGGLSSGTTYNFRVRARNSTSISNVSNVITVTTAEAAGGRTSSIMWSEEIIEDLESYDFTQIYPNPVLESLNIVVSKNDLLKRIDVYDVAGKLLLQQNNLKLKNTKYQLDLKHLETGTYIITGYSDIEQIFNERVLKE